MSSTITIPDFLIVSSKNIKFVNAIRINDIKLVISTVKEGSNVNTLFNGDCEYDYNALHVLIYKKYYDFYFKRRYINLCDIIEFLISEGINLEHKEKIHGKTPLYLAFTCNDITTARQLINHGADIDVKDNKGKSLWDRQLTNDFIELRKIIDKNHEKSQLKLWQLCYITCINHEIDIRNAPKYIRKECGIWIKNVNSKLSFIKYSQEKYLSFFEK